MAINRKGTQSINFANPLKISPQGGLKTNTSTIKAVSDNLRNLILTNYGDRPCLYDFGANLISLVFEPGSSNLEQRASYLIRGAVEKWMPFVEIETISVTPPNADLNPTDDPNTMTVFVQYKISQTGLTGDLEVKVNNR